MTVETTQQSTAPRAATARAEEREERSWPIVVATLVLLVALGEILPRSGLISRVVLPTPGDVVTALARLLATDYWLEAAWDTLSSVLIAWVIGCLFGFALGSLIGASQFARKVITPYALALQALPKIVLAPLFIGWLGFGAPPKIAIAVSICFFPVWIDTMVGLSLPSADEFKLLQALRASKWQVFRKLQLPTAVPMIMVGIKHAMLLSFTGVLVAEILASGGGLGSLSEEFALQLNMPMTFAVVTIVIVLAVTAVSALDALERRVVFWSDSARARNS